MTRRPCKACGRELFFITDGHTGKTVALDVLSRHHIYELLDSDESGTVAYPAGQQELYASHALLCGGVKRTAPAQEALL